MKPKTNKPKIGLEIEVNTFTDQIYDNLDRSIWRTKNEHCGTELISSPAQGASEIRRLAKSIKKLQKRCRGNSPGFVNAGTHIHIDFFSNHNGDVKENLIRMNAKKLKDGTYNNPMGNGKRYFWITTDGNIWAKPSDYKKRFGVSKRDTPLGVYSSTKHEKIIRDVKRFMTLGVRFAPVLFALQHPDRRFNKYCHTIEGWDEKILSKCNTIADIAQHPKLQQNHRRTMFNLLSFPKFGTVEIRMIKASLNYKDILNQINLFVRMSALAKSNGAHLPMAGKTITKSFVNLMDACGIHGKTRRRLAELFEANLKIEEFSCICYHYSCQVTMNSNNYTDLGLSRAVCKSCIKRTSHCCRCGITTTRYFENDKSLLDGRDICGDCSKLASTIVKYEKLTDTKYYFGVAVGSDIDKNGKTLTLKRVHDAYRKTNS